MIALDIALANALRYASTPPDPRQVVCLLLTEALQVQARLRHFRDLLEDIHDSLDTYVDVLDGDDGRPRPNAAMSIQTDIRDLLDRVGAG